MCQCDLNKKYWSSSETKCVDLYKYGEVGCISDNQCYEDLICDINGMCKCKHDFYWNDQYCVAHGDSRKSPSIKRNQALSQTKPLFKIIIIIFCIHFI